VMRSHFRACLGAAVYDSSRVLAGHVRESPFPQTILTESQSSWSGRHMATAYCRPRPSAPWKAHVPGFHPGEDWPLLASSEAMLLLERDLLDTADYRRFRPQGRPRQ